MGLFGKSFEEKVEEALERLRAMRLGVRDLGATVDGKVVTLTGETDSKEVKTKVMVEFNSLVETENTINMIRWVEAPGKAAEAPPAPAEAPPEDAGGRFYEVVPGDTLGGIAKKFYGKGSLYMKIFEANRDILDNPDLIKVGQRLRIPD